MSTNSVETADTTKPIIFPLSVVAIFVLVCFLAVLFVVVLKERYVSSSCVLKSAKIVDKPCIRPEYCHCSTCGNLPSCKDKIDVNITGLCCHHQDMCQGQKRYRVGPDEVCTATHAQCWYINATFSLHGHILDQKFSCSADDLNCKERTKSAFNGLIASQNVSADSTFTCWHQQKDRSHVYLESQKNTGRFITGVAICTWAALTFVLSLGRIFYQSYGSGRKELKNGEELSSVNLPVITTTSSLPPSLPRKL